MPEHSVKIAIVSHSLGAGGAERSAATLSRMLTHSGYEIHNIIINDGVDYPYEGKLLNLGHDEGSRGIFRKIRKARKLSAYLKTNRVSIIIDNRARGGFWRELMFKFAYGSVRKIFVVHSHNLLNYFPKSSFAAKMLYQDATLVSVSEAIADKIKEVYGFSSIVIQNPVVPFPPDDSPTIEENYILFFGRLDDKVKNFKLMIEAFAKSGISTDYKLLIAGNGPDKSKIEAYTREFNVESRVELLPFVSNPSNLIKNAKFCVLTSRFEGFPMSLIESLMCGTPVVSVDCQSGPSEIIRHRENGLLVPNNDVVELAESFKLFVSDAELYQICKSNSAPSVSHLSVENMLKKWKQILPSPE